MLRAVAWSDARLFLEEAAEFLSAREDINAVILGISRRIAESETPDHEENFFGLAYDGDTPVAAAFRTPPYGVSVSQGEAAAMELLADAAIERYETLPGANGPQTAVNAFAQRVSHVTGQRIEIRFEMRIHRLDAVAALSLPQGTMRRATADDAALMHAWMSDFNETTLGQTAPTFEAVFDRLNVSDPAHYLWCVDGKPVSTAAWSRPTQRGISVNAVYTPSEERGNGYGTAVVHGLSRFLLEERGYSFCTLYTDLANPTSNAIYARIGYRRVLDTRNVVFVA